MLRIWEELDRLENLFLELLDDPYKKEVLLYPICYCQQVRRSGEFELPLERILYCAEKPYKLVGGDWRDIFLELGIFYVKAPNGEIFQGKDILKIKDKEKLKVGIINSYREDFYGFYTKLLKYWSVLSSKSFYGNNPNPETSTRMLVLTFNEKLYKESKYYAELLCARYPEEKNFFEAIKLLAEFYTEDEKESKDKLRKALKLLKNLESFYSVDVVKLRKDIEKLINGNVKPITISFIKEKRRKRRGLFSRIWNFIKSLGGKRWSSASSEADYYYFIETLLRKPKRQPTMN
ncbi:hypothetical protein [Aquifex sp.]